MGNLDFTDLGQKLCTTGDPLLAIDKSEGGGQFYGAESFPCGVCAHFS